MSGRKIKLESPSSRFYAACAGGALVAGAVFAYFAFQGRFDPFGQVPLGNFYEVQARSWLHGRWDASAGDYLFERFNVDGRFYTYFGPWPALLRLPIVAVTRGLDGELSRLSMLLAFGVMMTFTARLSWQTRSLVLGSGAPTKRTLIAAAAFMVVAGCGSSALFLASESWVYHEAILWGIAWSIASFSYLVAYLVAPRGRTLALASLTAAFAYLSRGSVGLGPVAALGLLFAARLAASAAAEWRARANARRSASDSEAGSDLEVEPARTSSFWWLRLLGLSASAPPRSVWSLGAATGIPLAVYSYVNWAKFGTLLSTPPYELQDLLQARRAAALAANNGSVFGLKYAPTLVLDYFRPDGISFDRLFPWVSFAKPARIVGDAVFEAVNFSSSVTVNSTLLLALTAFGAWAIFRAASGAGDVPTAAVLRVPLLGAALGCAGAFLLAFVEQRYQGDFVPLLVLGGATGLWYVIHLIASRPRVVRGAVIGVLALAGVWSIWVTGSLTLLQQRAFGPLVSTDTRASFLGTQIEIHDVIPGGDVSRVVQGDLPLPTTASPQTLLVIGDCDGLYWSSGRFWHAVETTPRTGRFHLALRAQAQSKGTLEPVLSATDARGSSILWLRHLSSNRVRFEYEWTGKKQGLVEGITPDAAEIGQRTGEPITLAPGSTANVNVRLDPVGYVGVQYAGRQLLSTFAPVAGGRAVIGRQDVSDRGAATFSGTLGRLPTPTPLCDRLTS